MRQQFNIRLFFMALLSLAEEAAILALVVIILTRFGILVPVWLIALVAVLLAGWSLVSYRVMRKNPQMGFENMIGATGLTLDSLAPKGTVRIGREQWAAKASGGNIEAGVTVTVVNQTGLLLTVIRKEQTGSSEPHD